MGLALPARAKLNLDLRVRGRRDDGQHEVETLIQAISLHDLLLAERAADTSLEVEGLPVPEGPDNLVLQAAAALESAAGKRLPARFRLCKRIPPGAGLGGGSSDAATALRALARLHSLDVDLVPVAAGLGADVPFFLEGGAALATGRGDTLAPAAIAGGWFAVCWPGFPVSTGHVYAAWDRIGGEGGNQLFRAALEVEPRLAAFAALLGQNWSLTGSGSAFFRWLGSEAEARRTVAGLDCWSVVSAPVDRWA